MLHESARRVRGIMGAANQFRTVCYDIHERPGRESRPIPRPSFMPSQTRNYLLFFLSFILIFAGYSWFRNWQFPPPKPLPEEARPGIEELSRVIAASLPSGEIGDAARLVSAVKYTYKDDRDSVLAAMQEKLDNDKKAAEKAAAAKPKLPVKPAETIALGGDDYYLAVTLTNRGAGVRDLTLTPFEAADSDGKPALDANGKPLPLQLIPPSDETSFAVYHYAKPGDDRPLDTLGNRDWHVEKKINADEQQVSFDTELPEFGIKIVKTFTLHPHEYHLGLTVRIERLAGAKELKPFQYQLAGGHGLPIEGKWYTTVFRNALFDWIDANGKNQRNLLDNRTIASTGGSDRIAETGPRLQYAAVTNQYFASAIAVADDQDIIKFVRATVEATPEPTKQQFDDITVRAISDELKLKAGESVEHKYILYHGPIKVALLEKLGGKGEITARSGQSVCQPPAPEYAHRFRHLQQQPVFQLLVHGHHLFHKRRPLAHQRDAARQPERRHLHHLGDGAGAADHAARFPASGGEHGPAAGRDGEDSAGGQEAHRAVQE